MMTRRIMIGPLLIRPTRMHGSPVRMARTHGPDGEKALHNKLFGCPAWASGWPMRTGRFTKNHVRARHPASAHRA